MPLTKALLVDRDSASSIPIPVMFNPPEYQLQVTNQFVEVSIPGLGSSLLQFVSGSAQTLTMELFFDTTDEGIDVRVFTGLVLDLTKLNSETHAPPRLLFLWGSLIFPCVLQSVTQKFDYFNALGMPLRARLDVTLKENDTLQDLLGSDQLLSADRTKQWIFKRGDTLQKIAAQEYGDPNKWRPIARANNIDNPLTIPVGEALKIPALS